MPRFAAARVLALAVLAVATSSCDSLTGKKDGSFTIGLSDATVTVNQGKTDTVVVTITRKDFSKEITLTADGIPVGVSATLAPRILDGNLNQSLLVLTSAGTASPATGTITVHAVAEGVTEQTGTIGITVGVTGSFTLSSHGSPATAAAAAGGGAMLTILVPRVGGHADNVTFTVTGTPTGVSATMSPPQTTGTGASLAIITDATAVVGTYPIKVKATAPGNLADSVTVSLKVIAPPSTAALSLPYCPSSPPVWFAYQNEGYQWQRLVPAGSTFTFQATAKVAIATAYVIQSASRNETDLEIDYADRSELANQTDRNCQGTKTVNGSVSGASTGQSTRVSMGAALTTVTQANPTFALSGVADRVLDLTAVKGTITSNPSNIQVTPDKVIVRRALNPVTGSTLPALDFATESFTPATTSLTLANTGAGEIFNIASTLYTSTSSYGVVHVLQPTTTTNNLFSIPAAQLQPSDVIEVFAESYLSTLSTIRQVVEYLGALSDRTQTFGPLLATPTLSTLTSTPYVRLRGQVNSQPEYPSLIQFVGVQGGGTANPTKLVFLVQTAAYLGGAPATAWDIVMPDLSGVSGFNSAWALSSSAVDFEVDGYGGRIAILLGASPALGDVIKSAIRVVRSGSVLRAPARSAIRGPVRLGAQYLRR